MEWINDNWQIAVGSILALAGGWYVPVLRKLYILGLKSMLSEKVLTKVFITVAEHFVKSTKNTLDDVWIKEVKKKLN